MKSILLWLVFAGATWGQNLLCNGGFESPQFPASVTATDLPCWQTSGGQKIEVQRKSAAFVNGVLGSQYVELDVNSNSDIYQDIPTVVGQRYLIRFWMANRIGSTSSAYRILWDGAELGTAQRTSSETTFTRVFAEVAATKTVSRVGIAANGPSDSVGDLLDEVSVVAISTAGSRLGYNYYLPHFADGGGWGSSLLLSNLSPPGYFAANIEYTVYADDGTVLDPRLNGTVTLNPAGSTVIDSPRPAILRAGWVKVSSSEPLQASLIFRSTLSGAFPLEATVLARELTSETVAPFDNTNFITGFAAANPGTAPITLTFTFVDQSGLTFSTTTLPLGALAHTSFAFASKFPQVGNRKGEVRIAATDAAGNPANFLPLGLRFGDGGVFTTLPY